MQKIIITGGPGSGKSTLLDALAANGYHCVPEVSRSLIQEQVAAESDCLPWKDLNCFATLALDRMLADYKQAIGNNQTSFFDRGIPDIIAYLKVGGLEVNSRFYSIANEHRYAKDVFITPPWKEIYVNDTERWQTFDEACVLHETLVSVYSDLGYNLKFVPCLSVQDRVDYIVRELSEGI
ncbi:AAA family ATPase [Dyadobacter sp. CY312]|uniref:AAA family ATPase n=1 Tax=Dyadobacter sp. CY312 TaxID=2907303 RepID=UPI001F1AA48B|nr:AAA family ATPase [Dyadobacter sp. CY312]MCE7040848.1 AAA family ATPase [Dyadobacter sp. CY312]